MKRFMTITALTAVMGTSAFAASQAEMNAISMYYPEANFATLTDTQVAEMMTIAQSGKEDTDKATLIMSIAQPDNPSIVTADRLILTEYFPEWRINEMTEADKDRIVALVNRGADPESIRVQLLDDMEQAAPNLTEAEVAAVHQLVPEADLRVLTTEQVNHLRAALYGKDSDSDQRQAIENALDS
ncbi:hypothetical protein AL036_12935 [Salipiger aestuarii]|uniref:LTXXQ motif family protein n=1 Tax=Salipiger aestuarii TaxID=568098 RepID=A0A327XW06_9RHOB|nr:hypothetical protein [Salipiger aestuarii]EIE52136.1 hypothetical protein C357_05179 [Citreicella sp. 357]KAA8606845.1 hypothetical protein AL036_12935 [Salipiger aestuarii]KAA8609019.1 hypothetical protein AL037_15965 [Salipiger aestuarii]KAB2540609.1 hypothetical protein AL035_16665 [Salipiger aestuarii]RAK13178.1 hypothetical protein ATI53_10397 [Salipiger aestuarii]